MNGSVVECSPATRPTRVQFPEVTIHFYAKIYIYLFHISRIICYAFLFTIVVFTAVSISPQFDNKAKITLYPSTIIITQCSHIVRTAEWSKALLLFRFLPRVVGSSPTCYIQNSWQIFDKCSKCIHVSEIYKLRNWLFVSANENRDTPTWIKMAENIKNTTK